MNSTIVGNELYIEPATLLVRWVEIGSWFELPLHPEGTDLQRFHYTHGCCPESERAAREVINLPTHRKISMKEAERVVNFLHQYAKPC